MNPSTYELLAGIHAAPGAEVLVLPNSPNVILAAERAAELSEQARARGAHHARRRRAWPRCSPSTPTPSAEPTRRPWRARPTRCASAAWPRRPATTPRAASQPATPWATRAASWWPGATPRTRSPRRSSGIAAGAELLTCIAGEGAPLGRDGVESRVPDGVELEYHEGGQPAWWWLLCAE